MVAVASVLLRVTMARERLAQSLSRPGGWRCKNVAIRREHEWSFDFQSCDRGQKTGVVDGMVGSFGATVSVCVANVPLCPDFEPEKGDELVGPDVAGPASAVEFEIFMMGKQKILLKLAPILD
jgi:hypothetical protein